MRASQRTLRGRNRVQNACQRCRKHKIKCDGISPCRTCRNRGHECDFGAVDKQVLISERDLFDLQARLHHWEGQQAERRQQPDAQYVEEGQFAGGTPNELSAVQAGPSEFVAVQSDTTELYDEMSQNAQTNPLAPGQPTYVQETTGRLRYLGHSSTYAFAQQVLHLLLQNPPSNPSPGVLMSSDDSAQEVNSARLIPAVEQDISTLPSKGTASHYLHTVRFRTEPLFYLFDESDFSKRLRAFYSDPHAYAQANPVWHAHYLVLMAFGKALDPYEQCQTLSQPRNHEYFNRALRLLPDMLVLRDYPVEATEFFVSTALFLQSIDYRDTAILYVGLALRMAHLYAIHRDLQQSIVGYETYIRCRRLWWTIYTLNQRLSSNSGLPSLLTDRDITSQPPSVEADDEDEAASAIHVKVCRLLGSSIRRVYGSSEEDQQSFVYHIQTILRGAGDIITEIHKFSESCFGAISRVAAHLELAYHQCIIVTCRPALFCLLKIRLEFAASSRSNSPSTAINGLVQVCVDSATRAAWILDQLRQHNLLDTFLPFDLDCAFSTAFVLGIAAYVCPKVSPSAVSLDQAKDAIDAIATYGNKKAKLQKLEVERLERLLSQQLQPFLHRTSGQTDWCDAQQVAAGHATGDTLSTNLDSLFFEDFAFENEFAGTQMIDLAEALSVGDFWAMG